MSQWYYSKNGQRQGPVSSEQLRQLAASGQLQPSDSVWKEGMSQWTEAQRMKGLFPAAPTADSHVPPPMPSENDATARPSDSMATQSPAALRQKIEGLRQSIIQQVLSQSSDLPDAEPIATFRKGYADQQERLNQLKKRTQDLDRAKAECEVLDNACQQKGKELAAAEANLKQYARPLGKAAFEGVVLGQVQNQQIFNERSVLQGRVGELHAEHDRLSPSSDAGIVQKTKAKAQQLVVAGKIKLEETKIGKLEEQIGRQLIGSNQEDSVRCERTAGILAELAKHREVVAHRKRECDEARKALDTKKQQLATTLQMTNIEGSKSFNIQRQNCEAQITQIENQRHSQERQLVERLVASEIQGPLGQLLGELRDAQAHLDAMPPALVATACREEDAPSKNHSIPQFLYSWPAVLVLLTCCFPGGLYLVWTNAAWTRRRKMTWSGVWLAIAVLGIANTLYTQAATKAQIEEANRLWASGDKANAASKYRAVIKGGFVFTDREDGSLIVSRMVDYEAENGRSEEAKGIVENAERNDVVVRPETAAGKALLAQIRTERERQLAEREKMKREKAEQEKAKNQEEKANGEVFNGGWAMSGSQMQDFVDNPSRYKGKILTMNLSFTGQSLRGRIENGVMPINLNVEFRTFVGIVHSSTIRINAIIPAGTKAPPLEDEDGVQVTFLCKEGEVDDGNIIQSLTRR